MKSIECNEEFDYETVLKSISAQDHTLRSSYEQKIRDYNLYEEALNEYKIAKTQVLKNEQLHEELYAIFLEKMNILNSFHELQIHPNSHLKSTQQDILTVCNEVAKESDNFVDLVKNSVTKFQNLSTEFDETAILERKMQCKNQKEYYLKNIADLEETHTVLLENSKNEEFAKDFDICNLKKMFDFDDLIPKLEAAIQIKEAQLLLSQRNYEFLKQRNPEMEIL